MPVGQAWLGVEGVGPCGPASGPAVEHSWNQTATHGSYTTRYCLLLCAFYIFWLLSDNQESFVYGLDSKQQHNTNIKHVKVIKVYNNVNLAQIWYIYM